jgi:hypothetical protein
VIVMLEVAQTALARIHSGGAPRVTFASFAVMLVTLAINIFVVRAERRAGRRLNSDPADGGRAAHAERRADLGGGHRRAGGHGAWLSSFGSGGGAGGGGVIGHAGFELHGTRPVCSPTK